MRGWPLLVALAVALPGCAVPSNVASFFSDDEVTAKEVFGAAEDAARAWKADAAFAGAFAFESADPEFALHDDERNLTVPADPDVGNGKAVVWAFNFLSGETGATFLVNASGEVHMDSSGEWGTDDVVREWPVDSDEAMKAANGDDRFAAAVAEARAVGVALGDNGTGPMWIAFTVGPKFVFAIVDARSGDLVKVVDSGDWTSWGDWSGTSDWDWEGDWGGWGSSGGADCGVLDEGQASGSLTAVERTAEEPLDLDPGADVLTVTFVHTKRLPSDEVTFELVGPDGAVVEPDHEDSSEDDGAGSSTLAYEDVGPGPHTMRVTLREPGVAADYHVQYTVTGCR